MPDPVLTERQREVATLLAEGLSAREIAEQLGIQPGSVEMHRHQIYRTLGIGSIVQLVKYALAKGWTRNEFARGRPRKVQP